MGPYKRARYQRREHVESAAKVDAMLAISERLPVHFEVSQSLTAQHEPSPWRTGRLRNRDPEALILWPRQNKYFTLLHGACHDTLFTCAFV